MMFIEKIKIPEEEKRVIEDLQRQEKEIGGQKNQIDLDRCLTVDEAERCFHLSEAMEGIREIRERYFPFSK